MAYVLSWSSLGTRTRVWLRSLAFIFSIGHRDYLVFAWINLLETVSWSLRFVIPQVVSLIIHPQFRLHLLYSYLCSRLRLQGLAFLARSIYVV
jgi:hypothetical protein